MSKSTIKRIHVNQHVIKANGKTGERNSVFTVKNRGNNFYADQVLIEGPSTVIYQPDDPLSCGAKCWIETLSKVTLISKQDAGSLTMELE